MLAEIYMIWIESLRRRRESLERTTTPSTSPFVPFARNHLYAFKQDNNRA
jgi:hypothetical protein